MKSKKETNQSSDDTLFYGLTLNDGQKAFHDAIFDQTKQVVIANATAGAGKTLISVACSRILIDKGVYNGMIYIVPCNMVSELGYLPGGLEEKTEVFYDPLYDALEIINEMPSKAIKNDLSMKLGTAWCETYTPTFLRGVNFRNKVVIVDEAQNLTVPEIKRIVSRLHDNCKLILIGCIAQTDISYQKSGFQQTIDFLTLPEYADKVQVCQLPISYRGWLAQAIDKL